jgi:hypothetical protein
MDLVQSRRNRGVIWGTRGEEVDSDLGPGSSDFWERNVVLDEVVEGLGGIVKLGSCLRGHSSNAGVMWKINSSEN